MKARNTQHRRAGVALAAVVLALFIALCAIGEQVLVERFAELANSEQATFSKSGTDIDYGNAKDGYVMLRQDAGKMRYKLRVSRGDSSYTYDINQHGDYEVIPLQMGNGKYKFQMYKQKKGTEYTPLSSTSIEVKLEDKNICYLFPNQYVNYNRDTKAIQRAAEICEGLTTDREKVEAVYDWVAKHIEYDYLLAMSVKSGYLPDIDEVLETGMGICFGYSALMACMLRTQGIPTQLVIGYADKTYHAWNKVYLDGDWERLDATVESTGGKVNKYTEERRY